MTKLQKAIRYEKESGNTVLNNDRIVDSMGRDIGHFTAEMANQYHYLISKIEPDQSE